MTTPALAAPATLRITGFILEEEEDTSIEASASARIANAGSIALRSNSASGIKTPVGIGSHAASASTRLKLPTTSASTARSGASSRSGAMSENVGRRGLGCECMTPAAGEDPSSLGSGRCCAGGAGLERRCNEVSLATGKASGSSIVWPESMEVAAAVVAAAGDTG